MKKDSFYKFIIYKIFTSEYKDMFVLDGSYGLYLTINSKNKRKLGDLDLNEIGISTNMKDKNLINDEWNKVLNAFKDIFKQNKDIVVSWVYALNNVRTYNSNTIGAKLNIKYDNLDVDFDVSIVLNDSGTVKKIWNIKKEHFCKDFDTDKDTEVVIKTFNNEKYFVNKILSIMKETDNFSLYVKDISKSLYDIWFIINYLSELNWGKLVEQYNIMYNSEKSLDVVFEDMSQYLGKYLRVDSKRGWMSSFISKKVENSEEVSNYSIIRVVEDYFGNKLNIFKEEN